MPTDTAGAAPEHSPWMSRAAVVLVGLFAVTICLLWVTGEPTAATFAGTAPDPLAARRQAARPPDAGEPPDQAADAHTARGLFEPLSSAAASAGAGDDELPPLERAVERDPLDAEAHRALGQRLVGLDRIDNALPHLERAIVLEPERGSHRLDLARALARLRRWRDAAEAYRLAQRLLPDDAAIAFELGQSLHKTGDDAAAVDAFTRAIELDRSDASFHLALAISHERREKKAEAAAAYEEYLRLVPEDPDAQRVRTRIAQLTTS